MGIVIGKPVTLGELVRVAAAAKAKEKEEEKAVDLEIKIAVITENQASYHVYRL